MSTDREVKTRLLASERRLVEALEEMSEIFWTDTTRQVIELAKKRIAELEQELGENENVVK